MCRRLWGRTRSNRGQQKRTPHGGSAPWAPRGVARKGDDDVSEPPATVRILKLAAAQRQLDAAIRMFFAEEDELAVTTVAAAAYRILRDIAEKRGQKIVANDWRDTMLGVARAYVKNELPEDTVSRFKADSQMWPVISILAEKIREVGSDRTIAELRAIVSVEVPAQAERSHWGAMNKAANFLKHADVDYDQSLDAGNLNSEELIFGASRLYFDLMGYLTAEMEVWSAHHLVTNNVDLPRSHPLGNTATAFMSIDSKHRRAAGIKLIAIQRKCGSGVLDPPGTGEE
jgi:hypothetical protein